MMTYPNALLYHATEESQRIEGEPVRGKSFTNHWRAALLCRTAAQEFTLLHPRVVHQVLAEGLSLPPGHQSGDYRHARVYVNTADGPHYFPPPEQVPALMQAWWTEWWKSWAYSNPDMKEGLVRWWFHAWFEAIHPFPDFNGRAGRCVLWGMDMLAGQSIEVVAYEERQFYYDRLEAWRRDHCNAKHMNPFR